MTERALEGRHRGGVRRWHQLVAPLLPLLLVPSLVWAAAQNGLGEIEPNDTPEQANELDPAATTQGQLGSGDVDHYRFAIDATLASQLFDLVIDSDAPVEVALADAEGLLLQERRGSGGALRSLHLPEGSYRFSIGGDEGSYTLSFRTAGSPIAGQEEEPNDTPASAYSLDDSLTVRGELVFRDSDLYRFSIGGEGGRYRVQVLGRDPGLARVAVLDASGAERQVQEVPAGERRARLEDVPLPPGEYLLRVEGEGTEYAVRFFDLGELAARPPDLEAETNTEQEALEVETVMEEPVEEAAPPPAPPPGTACVSPLDRLEGAAQQQRTVRYADANAYLCGESVNLVVEGDRLRLSDEPAAFRFIWVAASQRGTVIKIDTDSGEILGEYWTAPVYDPERPSQDPSRSVVDRDGNAWIGNRQDEAEEKGSVVHVGLLENGQCKDRNGDGVISTSQGLGDVLPWSNDGDADRMGGVSTAEDECILHYVRVEATGVRHVSVDADNNVWVSGTGEHVFDLVDGDTGTILRTEAGLNCGGYGGLIDRAGVLWSARPLLRWDPAAVPEDPDVVCDHGWSYGLGLGPDDRVWASDLGHSVCRLSRQNEVEVCFDAGDDVGSSRGVAVTDDGHVWVVHSSGDSVTRFTPEGEIRARIAVGARPTGIAVDTRGKVWVTNLLSSDVMRIDPATDTIDLTVSLGDRGDPDELPFYDAAYPYTYSDMTGQLVFGPPDSGTWRLLLRGPSFRTRWHRVRYAAEVPPGAAASVRVAAQEGGDGGGARVVASGEDFDLEGPFLVLEVTMERAPDGSSPSIGAFEIDLTPQLLAPGAVAVSARPDLVANSNAIEVIFDASGSMGQLLPEGVSRMEAARSVLLDLADSAFPAGVPLALRVFGHLEPTTCHQMLELPLSPFDAERFKAAVRTVEPKLLSGTPLADTIAAAGEDLAGAEGRAMVVLVTDGEESCGGDPRAAIEALAAAGVDTVNIVGFALDDDEIRERFRAWAELGNGRYLDASGGEGLAAALNQILQPEFLVLDTEGIEVAHGRVNSDAVEVPSGIYRIRVLSVPEKVIDGVRVVEREVRLTVALREAAP